MDAINGIKSLRVLNNNCKLAIAQSDAINSFSFVTMVGTPLGPGYLHFLKKKSALS